MRHMWRICGCRQFPKVSDFPENFRGPRCLLPGPLPAPDRPPVVDPGRGNGGRPGGARPPTARSAPGQPPRLPLGASRGTGAPGSASRPPTSLASGAPGSPSRPSRSDRSDALGSQACLAPRADVGGRPGAARPPTSRSAPGQPPRSPLGASRGTGAPGSASRPPASLASGAPKENSGIRELIPSLFDPGSADGPSCGRFPGRPVFSGPIAKAGRRQLADAPQEGIQEIREFMEPFPAAIAKLPMQHHAVTSVASCDRLCGVRKPLP